MDILAIIFMVFIGLILADLTTACVHFVVDNYASRDWPFIGKYYVAFAHDHHDDPMELLRLPFIKVHWFIVSFAALMAIFLVLINGLNIITISALIFGACTNLIHSWSHRTHEENGPLINAAHKLGILQSPRHHDYHHNNDSSSYALLTDYMNPILEAFRIFPLAEKFLSLFGLHPHWWESEKAKS